MSFSFGVACCLIIMGSALLAADDSVLKVPMNQPLGQSGVQLKPPGLSDRPLQIGTSFKTYNYANEFDATNSQQSAFQENNFFLDFKYQNFTKNKILARGFFQTDLNRSQNTSFAVPEVSYKYFLRSNLSESQTLQVGRSIQHVSDVDTRLNLGLIHPYYTQDHLSYETQGLTGVEYTFENRQFGFYVGAYPVFLPNQDPGVKVEDGRVIAQNRWASQAPRYFVFNDNKKDINYEIKNYKISEIIFNPGYRLGTVFKPTDSVFVNAIAIGLKRAPMNNIILSRETYANLDIEGQVKLSPVVNYSQQIYSDVIFKAGRFNIILSYLNDRPDSIKAQTDQSIQSMASLDIKSLTLEAPAFNINELEQKAFITVGEISGGDIQDLNSDGSASIITVSKHRQKYYRPIKFGSVNRFYLNFKNPLATRLEYTYDSQQKGALLSFESSYALSSPLMIKAGLDVLGSDYSPNTDDDSADYFLVRHQASDRFFAGVNYVF